MKYLLILVSILLIVLAVGYGVRSTHDVQPSNEALQPSELPIMPDRRSDPGSNQESDVQPSNATSTPVRTHSYMPWQRDALRTVLKDTQPIPDNDGGNEYQLIKEDAFEVRVIESSVGDKNILILLTKPPLYSSREQAEQAFVKLFGGEREDLCGFPIVVRAAPGLGREGGDLGIEQCGTSKITESE